MGFVMFLDFWGTAHWDIFLGRTDLTPLGISVENVFGMSLLVCRPHFWILVTSEVLKETIIEYFLL